MVVNVKITAALSLVAVEIHEGRQSKMATNDWYLARNPLALSYSQPRDGVRHPEN